MEWRKLESIDCQLATCLGEHVYALQPDSVRNFLHFFVSNIEWGCVCPLKPAFQTLSASSRCKNEVEDSVHPDSVQGAQCGSRTLLASVGLGVGFFASSCEMSSLISARASDLAASPVVHNSNIINV